MIEAEIGGGGNLMDVAKASFVCLTLAEYDALKERIVLLERLLELHQPVKIEVENEPGSMAWQVRQ